MKQLVTSLFLAILGILFLMGCQSQKTIIRGPEGKIAYQITLPDGFDTTTEQCPMVILMHGIFSSKDYGPMPQLAKGLAEAGIASIRFDFNGHGKSDGRKQDMTIEKEIADAKAVWDYVQSLPYVNGVGMLGHSQGGVIASMAAGRLSAENSASFGENKKSAGENKALANKNKTPLGVVLIAPGSVIKEACQGGKFFNATFDPKDPPEYIRCWGLYKLGREYLVTTQQLDIFGTSAAYQGPVLILHGDRDGIVPMWCSERYVEAYGSHATLKVIEGENHTITRRRKQVVGATVEFFKEVFKKS